MRSGEPYAVVLAPSAHRLYKKFDAALQDRIKEEAQKVARMPPRPSILLSRACALITSSFATPNIGSPYRIREDKRRVEIVLVRSRERFYEVLARTIRQR